MHAHVSTKRNSRPTDAGSRSITAAGRLLTSPRDPSRRRLDAHRAAYRVRTDPPHLYFGCMAIGWPRKAKQKSEKWKSKIQSARAPGVERGMKETFGAFLLIVYGAIIGLLLAPILGVNTSAWTAIATGIRDFTTALGICIGGVWAYGKYLRNREGEVRVQLSHSVTSVELDQRLLLRIELEIKNVGPVAALPSTAHTLVQLPPELPVDGSKDPSTVWMTLHRLEFDFKKDHLCIEPGDMVHYSRDVTLDASTRYVQLYTRTELGVDSWHTDETSVHKLNPTAAVAGTEIKQQTVPSETLRP